MHSAVHFFRPFLATNGLDSATKRAYRSHWPRSSISQIIVKVYSHYLNVALLFLSYHRRQIHTKTALGPVENDTSERACEPRNCDS